MSRRSSQIASGLGMLSSLLSLSCAIAIAGCGSSGTEVPGGASPSKDGGSGADASVSGQGDGGSGGTGGDDASTGDDATAGDDSGSDVYPAAHHPLPPMIDFGGPVLASPKIITVTFAGETLTNSLRAFDDGIVTTPWWTAVTKGYGIGVGSSGGHVELPDTVSNTTLDDETGIVPLVQDLVAQGKLPTPDANTLYVFYFPAATTITLEGDASCQAFGGYHSSALVTLEGGVVDAAYAIMPDCVAGFQGATDADRLNSFTAVGSHEIIEAATDPHPLHEGTYYMWNDAWSNNPLGGEVADCCENRDTVTEGAYSVSRSWDHATAQAGGDPCQPAADPSLVYYNAALDTESIVMDRGTINEHLSDGYVVVKRGESKTKDVVVYSQAALPHDVTLAVGARSRNPPAVDPLVDGVTPTLSRTSGRNGTKLSLTIDVASTVQPGDYPFVIRAVLDPASDYNSWYAILRVE